MNTEGKGNGFQDKKNISGTLTRVSNCLDPEQDRQNVGPDLGPNCLQKVISRIQQLLLADERHFFCT